MHWRIFPKCSKCKYWDRANAVPTKGKTPLRAYCLNLHRLAQHGEARTYSAESRCSHFEERAERELLTADFSQIEMRVLAYYEGKKESK